MTKVPQTKDELQRHLKEQIQFLLRSSQSYDKGSISEAKRLAVIIRVLFHDTQKSTSLLTLLQKKDISLYDTSLDYDPKNLISTMGLVIMKVGKNGGYVPPLDDLSPARYVKGKISFNDWWNKIVFVDKKGNKLTRKDLILAVSNKDGGAHIDPTLDKAYADLTRFDSLGWQFVVDGADQGSSTGPELASIRQISHEVLKSFRDEFPDYF